MADAFDAAVAGLTALDIKGKVIKGNGSTPRFDLFHIDYSICSWKCRSVMLEKGIPWTSWQFAPRTHNQYQPAYVKLRALGNPDPNNLVGDRLTGDTAMASQGFDPLVVPTLVDRLKKRVVVDSKVICEYIDKEVPEPALVPEQHSEAVAKHLRLVDETPHMGMLYSLHLAEGIEKDPVILSFAKLTLSMPASQRKSVESWLASPLDQELRPLYEAKLKKVNMVAKKLGKEGSKEEVMELHRRAKSILGELEGELAACGGPFICGDTFTMADVFWFTSLLRLTELGFESYFANDVFPHVHTYSKMILRRPALRNATYLWPFFPVSSSIKKLMQETKPVKGCVLNLLSKIALSCAA